MNTQEYSKLALRTANDLGGRLDNIMHAAMGIAGEAGEVIDLVKKTYAYEKTLDDKKLIEEVSDILWYINLLLAVMDRTWEEVFDLNIAKLEARYPDLRFNADHAINRDVNAEQKAMLVKALGNYDWATAEDDNAVAFNTGALR